MQRPQLENKDKLLLLATLAALMVIVLGSMFLLAPVWQFRQPANYQPVTAASQSQAEVSAQPEPVDLNTADADTLQTLPGIGPAKAAAIIAYREENGPFADVKDAAKVSGISEKMTETWQGMACVSAKEKTQ